MSIEDLADSNDGLIALYGYLTSPDMNVSAELEADHSDIQFQHILTYGFVTVGGWRFGALAQWEAIDQSISQGRWQGRLVNRNIVGRYTYEATDADAFADFNRELRRFSEVPGTLVMDDDAVARLTAQTIN